MASKIIEREWEDVDIEKVVFVDTIPSIQVHVNPNTMVETFIEFERATLIAMCKAFGIKADELS